MSYFSIVFYFLPSQDVANYCLRPRRGLWRSAGVEASAVGRRFWTCRRGGKEKRIARAATPLIPCRCGFAKRILIVESQERSSGGGPGYIPLTRTLRWESIGKFDNRAGDDSSLCEPATATISRTRSRERRCYDSFGREFGKAKLMGPKCYARLKKKKCDPCGWLCSSCGSDGVTRKTRRLVIFRNNFENLGWALG